MNTEETELPIVQALSNIDLSLGISEDFLKEKRVKYKGRRLKLVKFSPPSEGYADIYLYTDYGEVMVQLYHPQAKPVHVTLTRFEQLVSDPSFQIDGTWFIDPPLDH